MMNIEKILIFSILFTFFGWIQCQNCTVHDCNHNCVEDFLDLLFCKSQDINFDGIPDECLNSTSSSTTLIITTTSSTETSTSGGSTGTTSGGSTGTTSGISTSSTTGTTSFGTSTTGTSNSTSTTTSHGNHSGHEEDIDWWLFILIPGIAFSFLIILCLFLVGMMPRRYKKMQYVSVKDY